MVTSLGSMLRHVPLRAMRGVGCGSRAGHFICPAVLVLMTMTNVRTPRVGGSGWDSPSGWSQGSPQGLPRRRASARLQAVPLVCRASGRLAVLDLGLLPWFTSDNDNRRPPTQPPTADSSQNRHVIHLCSDRSWAPPELAFARLLCPPTQSPSADSTADRRLKTAT